jgi:hypothetical protein
MGVATVFGIALGQEPNAPPNGTAQAEHVTAAHQVAEKITAVLPKGWTAKDEGDHVIVEMTKPVEVFNPVGLASGEHATVLSLTYRLRLRLGKRMSDEQYRKATEDNRRAVAKVEAAMRGTKHPLDEYLHDHPEYGYRYLPWLDTGQEGLYVERTFSGHPQGFLRFQSKEVEAECHQVDESIARLFRRYDSKLSP